MRRGGFGALLALTVAILLANGQGGSSTGSAAGSLARSGLSSALEPAAGSVLPSSGKGGDGALLERGVCQLQTGNLASDEPCGECKGFCPADDLRSTIESFFRHPGDAPLDASLYPDCKLPVPPKQNLAETERDLQRHWNVPYEVRGSLRFVIATMPDPTHTHLTLTFDRQIAAVTEAAQQQGYLFSRSFLPWDTAQHPESSTLATRLTAADWPSQVESLPGLMIFRKRLPLDPCDAAKVLFVFVAGERPTGGINKQQFLDALQIMAAIRKDAPESTPNSPLLILGPNFSGSLYSLHYLLEDDSDTRPVIIHSGTASSYSTIRWFQSRRRKRDLVFRSFQESDQYALQHFLAFAVGQQKYDEQDIAFLSEDETAYGDQLSEVKTPGGCDSCAVFSPSSYPPNIPHFYFPRDISHLRSAYQLQIQAAASSNSGSSPARTTLPLNIEDTGSDDDSVRIYSPGQTPLSEEAILQGIVSNLQKHRSVFVLLQATNPLDTLFLSHYLRRAYPEGRIVTIGEDSLLSREVDEPRFQGILALTSYSLLPGIDDQVRRINANLGAAHSDLVFPWNYSVGAFNAMVALLNEPSKLPGCDPALGRCQDLPAAAYAEYGWPEVGGRAAAAYNELAPPLWLTVIGSNGYWPVALLDDSRHPQLGPEIRTQIHSVNDCCNLYSRKLPRAQAPHDWKMLCLVFMAAVILYLFLRYSGSILALSKIAANFAPVDDSYSNYGLFIADVMFFAIAFLLLAPWRYTAFALPDWPLHYSLWAILIFLAIISFVDFLKRGSYWFAALSPLSAALLWSISSYLALQRPSSLQNLSLYRYVHITSGVSPLLPFLILGLAGLWWSWYTLAGLVLTDKRGPRLPAAKDFTNQKDAADQPVGPPLRLGALTRERNQDLLRVAHPANGDHRVILLPIFAVLLSFFVIDPSHPVRSLEGQGYDRLYAFVFTAVLLVLLFDLFRLVVVWIELRRPLAALDRLTLRRGFLRLEDLRGKPIWRLGGSAFDDFFALLSREIEALRSLRKFLSEDREAGQKDALCVAIHKVETTAGELGGIVIALRRAQQARDSVRFWQRVRLFLRFLQKHPWRRLRTEFREFRARVARKAKRLKGTERYKNRSSFRRYLKALSEMIMRNPTAIVLPKLFELQSDLASACAKVLLFLSPRWDAETVAPQVRPERPELVTEFRFQKTSLPRSTQIAEDFVCLFYYNFIASIFLRLRTLLMSVAGMFVFLVLSFNSYPFQPQTSWQTLMVFVFILIVALGVFVIAQMSRDTTLSHITNTTPGELGWDFWVRITSFVAIPLLSLLSAQFPQIGSFLFSWAQPALNTFK
jgi:hypothetical protein